MSRRRCTVAKTGFALGGQFGTVIQELDKRFMSAAETLHPITIDPEALLCAMYPPECITHMRTAYRWMTESQKSYQDSGSPTQVWPGVTVCFPDWREHKMVQPHDLSTWINDEAPEIQKLLTWCREIDVLRVQYAKVRRAVEWTHAECTVAGVRYYFPAVIGLMTDQSQHDAARDCNPKHLGTILPLLREATEIIAASTFLPPRQPTTTPAVCKLYFTERTCDFHGVEREGLVSWGEMTVHARSIELRR